MYYEISSNEKSSILSTSVLQIQQKLKMMTNTANLRNFQMLKGLACKFELLMLLGTVGSLIFQNPSFGIKNQVFTRVSFNNPFNFKVESENLYFFIQLLVYFALWERS